MPTPFAPMGQQTIRFAKQYQAEWTGPADPSPTEARHRLRDRWASVGRLLRVPRAGRPTLVSEARQVPEGPDVGATRPAS
jgi:hypothetical protein